MTEGTKQVVRSIVTSLAVIGSLITIYLFVVDNGKLDKIITILTTREEPKEKTTTTIVDKPNKTNSSSEKSVPKKEIPPKIIHSNSSSTTDIIETQPPAFKITEESDTKEQTNPNNPLQEIKDITNQVPNQNSHVIDLTKATNSNYETDASLRIKTPEKSSDTEWVEIDISQEDIKHMQAEERASKDPYVLKNTSANEPSGTLRFNTVGRDYINASLVNQKTKERAYFIMDFTMDTSSNSIYFYGIAPGRYKLYYVNNDGAIKIRLKEGEIYDVTVK